MRVGIVCGGGIVSGKEIMVLELADGLRSSGYEIVVVNSHWGDGNFARRLKKVGLQTHPVWFGFISATLRCDSLYMTLMQILRWPQLLLGYRSFLRRFRPEKVIHTNWHSLLTIGPFLKSQRDIYWVHEVMPKKPQYRSFFLWLDRRVQCFVTVSHAVAGSLRALGIAESKIRVIHNGIADPIGDVLRTERVADKLKIGIVGQIGTWKGHEDLLEAFQIVRGSFPDTQLHIFGKGSPEYEAVLRRRATELSVEKNVVWRGFAQNKTDIYGDIDLLVVPSRSDDALPTSAIEAAFFEVPVIASRGGGLIEIVEDGVTGYLFESCDVVGLANHAMTLLGSGALRATMGRKARSRAMSFFGRERFVEEFIDLLTAETP